MGLWLGSHSKTRQHSGVLAQFRGVKSQQVGLTGPLHALHLDIHTELRPARVLHP